MPELLVILVVALLVLGPKRLPEMARSLGRGMAEFRRASTDLRNSLQTPIDDEPTREPKETTPEAAAKPESPKDPTESSGKRDG